MSDNSHAGSVAAQLRAAAEDEEAPAEARELARERLAERPEAQLADAIEAVDDARDADLVDDYTDAMLENAAGLLDRARRRVNRAQLRQGGDGDGE